MPRSCGHTPSELEELKQKARWRLLLRNAKFQEGLNDLKSRVPIVWPDEGAQGFCSTWGYSYYALINVLENKSIPPLSNKALKIYEALFDQVYFGSSVTIWDAYNPIEEDERGVRYAWDWEPPPNQRGQRYILYVDLSKCTLDLALRMVEENLRKAVTETRTQNGLKHVGSAENPPKQRRERLDKLDFQLNVFDMAHAYLEKIERKALTYVAANLHAKPSTVKSAYWVACYKIGVEGTRERSKVSDPGPFDQCQDPQCRAAQMEDDIALILKGLCKPHKALWLKVDPCLRETVRSDLSPIEHAAARRGTGRRPSKHSGHIEE